MFRFPHLEVLPWYGSFLGRILNRPFTKHGDSGTWVFDVQSGSWIGMVVAGDDRNAATFIAEAGPLVDYFEQMLLNSLGTHLRLQSKYQRTT
jgi:hypothetical protein